MRNFQMLKFVGLFMPILIVSQFCFADVADDLAKAEEVLTVSQYVQAEQIYQNIINRADPNKSEEFESAFNARKKLPLVYLAIDQQSNAQVVVQQLLTKHADNERLPHAVHEIVGQAKELNKMLEAGQIYQNILTAQPNHPQTIWLKMGIAVANVHLNNDQAVDTTLQNIIAQHVADERSAEALGQTAWAYRKLEQHDKTRKVYRYVVDNWPNKDRAVFSQRGIVLCSLELQNQAAADAGTQQLLQNFAADKNIAQAIWAIAKVYKEKQKWGRMRPLCEYILQNHPGYKDAIWAQQALIVASINQEDTAGFDAGLQALFAKFSSHKKTPLAVYKTARQLESKNDIKARELCQYIVDNHPDHDYAPLAKVNLGQIKVRQGDEVAAEAIFDEVLNRYKNHPRLPQAVHLMAEGYLDQAIAMEQSAAQQMGSAKYAQTVREQGRPEAVKDYCRRAIEKWQTTIHELPPAPRYTEQAWYFTGVVYRRHLREPEKALQYYQKIVEQWPDYEYVWSAQSMIALCYETLARSGQMTAQEAEPKIEQAYEAVLERYPGGPLTERAVLNLGQLNFRKGQWDKAASYFGLFLEKYPNSSHWHHALVSLGITYWPF